MAVVVVRGVLFVGGSVRVRVDEDENVQHPVDVRSYNSVNKGVC